MEHDDCSGTSTSSFSTCLPLRVSTAGVKCGSRCWYVYSIAWPGRDHYWTI